MPKPEVYWCQPSWADLATGSSLHFVPQLANGQGGWLGVPNRPAGLSLPLAHLPGAPETGPAIFRACWPGLSLPKSALDDAGATTENETGVMGWISASEWRPLDLAKVQLAKQGELWLQLAAAPTLLVLAFAVQIPQFSAALGPGLCLSHTLPGKTWALPLWIAEPGPAEPTKYGANISDWALGQFRKYYRFAEMHDERAWANGEYVNQLFNFRDFEHCRVVPDFAGDLRALIELGEGVEVKRLAQTLATPNFTTAKHFEKVAKVFGPILRRFERGGRSLCVGSESYEVISTYFATAGEAFAQLAQFFAAPDFDQPLREINLEDIFYYCAGVLTDPTYQAEYAYELQREVPSIPLYPNFWDWHARGQRLAKPDGRP
jgi:Type ISP C-terminal specificity domain